MGKTRDLFKKIEAIKRTFHARMSTKKDWNKLAFIPVPKKSSAKACPTNGHWANFAC